MVLTRAKSNIGHFASPNRDLFTQKQTHQKFYSRKELGLNSSSNYSLGKNPITQDPGKYIEKAWKPSIKKNNLWNFSTFTKPSNDEVVNNRNFGTFNDRLRPMKDDVQWRSSIQRVDYYYEKPKIDGQVDINRGTKRVQSAYKARNPILQTGDIKEIVNKPVREPVQPSENYKLTNEKKFAVYDLDTLKPRREKVAYENKYKPTERPLLESRHERLMKAPKNVERKSENFASLLNYSFAGDYKDQGVSSKPGNLGADKIEKAMNMSRIEDKFYGKKKNELTNNLYPNLREV